jgi:hypothetical protein
MTQPQAKLLERFESLVNLLVEETQRDPEFLLVLNTLAGRPCPEHQPPEHDLEELLRSLYFHLHWHAAGGF